MKDAFGLRTTKLYQICLAEILNRSAKAQGIKVRGKHTYCHDLKRVPVSN